MNRNWLSTSVLAVGALSLVLQTPCAAVGEVFLDEDFQSSAVDAIPASVTYTIFNPASSKIGVVGAESTPPDPLGPAGNQSLAMFDRESGSDVRAGFKGTLPDAGLSSATIQYRFYAFDDGVVQWPPVVSIRAGLNNDLTGATRIDNTEAAFLLSIQATSSFVPQIVLLEGGAANTVVILEQGWDFNTMYDVAIEADFAAQTWSATLNGVPLSKPGGVTTFDFWYPVTGLNQFDLVSGAGSNRGSTVYFDDLLIEGVANPSFSGDFNRDGVVDAADYTVWRDNLGATGLTPGELADGNFDGSITTEDYDVWKSLYVPAGAVTGAGTVPEPGALAAALCVLLLTVRRGRNRLR